MTQSRFALKALVAACGAVLSIGSATAVAQNYPNKPIELTVHTSAGSGGDLVSRTVAEIIRKNQFLPQTVLVNNRVGGAGAIAYTFFQKQKGDPYHMLSVTGTLLAIAARSDTNIGLQNYTPVALMAIDPQTIMVPMDSPYKSFKELIEAAKAKPETLVAATTSLQGTGRMVVWLIERNTGAKFRFVTFKGGGDAVTSTAGGHTTFTTENLGEGLGFIEGKKLRVLAIASDKRMPQAPDVPTLQELGYPITAGTIRGFTFTAGVPKEAVTVMESTMRKVHDSPEWKEVIKRNVFQDVFLGSADFSKHLKNQMEEYMQFYQSVGLAKKGS